MKAWMCVLLLLGVACTPLEEATVTSPLVGATRIEERGHARVLETLKAGRYTYLTLEGAPQGTWHVISTGAPQVGQTLTYRGYGELRAFHSKRLDRTFERVVFSSIQTPNKTQ